MKAVLVCIITFAGGLALPTDHDEPQFKTLSVDPIVGKLPPDLSGRITNGVEAVPHSIPYQAYLVTTDSNGSRWLCGGSLISPKHVLTAGHCVDNVVSADVYLGAHNVQQTESTRIMVKSQHIIRHESYDSKTISNDIGLIVLDSEVVLDENVNVIALPTLGDTNTYEGANARVSGWGLVAGDQDTSPVLLEVNSTVMSNAQCRQVYPAVLDTMLCISGVGGVGTCNGDSGGPLVFDNVQIGIVSFGVSGCLPGYPSGLTRITSFMDWIEEKTGLNF